MTDAFTLRQGRTAETFANPTADRTRAAQLCQLRAAAPLRPTHGRTADVDGLALFDVARSPRLL